MGNTAVRRSSARMRCKWMGTRLPLRKRRTARARETFQRQRAMNMGDCSTACVSTSLTVEDRSRDQTVSRGKLCRSPKDSTSPSSVAAACSSKSKLTQNRFRKASPQARLMRPPNGE